MLTKPLLQKTQQKTPIGIGLEGSVVELYHSQGLFVVARENLLSQTLFKQYGTLTAQCTFDHSYVGALRKLTPFINAENDLVPSSVVIIDKGETHTIYEFTKYDSHTLNNWRRHINGGLVREFQLKLRTVFIQEPIKYGLR